LRRVLRHVEILLLREGEAVLLVHVETRGQRMRARDFLGGES
jgi:hypothetical protein